MREDTAFVSDPLWKASKLSPEPLWVAIRDVHAIYWCGLWHDSGNNKPLPQESSNLSLVLSEESTKSSCGADLVPRSKLSQAELQNLICQQMSRGGSKPLLSFKPPYVWNLVAQKDQQGDPALGGMGQMPTRVHRWATSCPAATAVPFFSNCKRCLESSGPGHVEAQQEVSDSSAASFPCMSPVFVK